MPRSNLCKGKMPLADFIRGKMGRRHQEEVAKAIGMTQQNLSRKLCTNKFTVADVHKIVNVLDFTDQEIVFAMRECR